MEIIISLILAVVPGALIIKACKKRDKKLGRWLLFLGMLSVAFACFWETVGAELLIEAYAEDSYGYQFIDSFAITAFSEECGKFFIFLLFAYFKSKNRYESCVNGIMIGLGFGLCENLFYAMDGDIFVMCMRAIMCVPGHAFYGFVMGEFFYEAKSSSGFFGMLKYMMMAFLIPVLQHGLYDFCIGSGNGWILLWTVVYNMILYHFFYMKMKQNYREYLGDESPIPPSKSAAQVSVTVPPSKSAAQVSVTVPPAKSVTSVTPTTDASDSGFYWKFEQECDYCASLDVLSTSMPCSNRNSFTSAIS